MKSLEAIGLEQVQAVYSGPEGRLWELLMGEQIHIGGLQSSLDLAARAGILPGTCGIDLCCASGAGMRFLLRFQKVARMTGVDATPAMLALAKTRSAQEELGHSVEFVHADVCSTGLPDGAADFVWGEDAWCYVKDKPGLIAEAARLVKAGGTIAFTDWVEGPQELSPEEAKRLLAFMKFPSLVSSVEYCKLLERCGCRVVTALDTGRFADYVPLYIEMFQKQLTYDALKILGFNQSLAEALGGEMRFLESLAKQRKISQALIVAKK